MYNQQYLIKYLKETVLPACRDGNRNFLGVLQSVFAYPDERQLQAEAAAIDEEILSGISVKELIWLSENFRSWDFYTADAVGMDIDFRRENFGHLSDGQYDALLKFGTFMANGYNRQRCMEMLWQAEGALPFLILRMNDWVAPIRERAFVLAGRRLYECPAQELFFALPMLEKVAYSGRRDEDKFNDFRGQIEHVIFSLLRSAQYQELHAICRCEAAIKNAFYRFVNQHRVLELEQMERLLATEKTGYGKRMLILGIMGHYDCDREKLEKYLASKSPVVRYHALLYRYEREKDAWAGLERMLLDASRRIRENAAYILVKCRAMDVVSYYLQELDRQVSKNALLGIGENGTRRELETILPCLENPDEQICKAALTAYGNLASSSGDTVYWRFLSEGSPVLARQAYRLIQKYRIPYSAASLYNGYLQNRGCVSGECFLKLLLCAPSWQRLPYLLMLYCDADFPDQWRGATLSKICERSLYAKVSAQQAQEICDLLERNAQRIPPEVSRGIRLDLGYVTK